MIAPGDTDAILNIKRIIEAERSIPTVAITKGFRRWPKTNNGRVRLYARRAAIYTADLIVHETLWFEKSCL